MGGTFVGGTDTRSGRVTGHGLDLMSSGVTTDRLTSASYPLSCLFICFLTGLVSFPLRSTSFLL